MKLVQIVKHVDLHGEGVCCSPSLTGALHGGEQPPLCSMEEDNPLCAAYTHVIRVSRIAFDVISSRKKNDVFVVSISTYNIVLKLEVAKIYDILHINLNVVARTNTTNVF